MRHMFGFFPAGLRGSGQYQPQLHAICVAGAQRVAFDTRPTAQADELFHATPERGVRSYLISMRRFADDSPAALGTRSVSTPFSNLASARSRSMPAGSGT